MLGNDKTFCCRKSCTRKKCHRHLATKVGNPPYVSMADFMNEECPKSARLDDNRVSKLFSTGSDEE